MALVLDTGPLLAALDAADPDHGRCAALLRDATERLLVPGLVLAELGYWCEKRLGVDAWLVFLEDVEGGAYELAYPTVEDIARCRALQTRYADLGLGIVDASIVALLERLEEPVLATLDRRHFGAIRPAHVEALRLIPG